MTTSDPKSRIKSGTSPGWIPADGHRIELAFLCDSRESLNALYDSILEQGYASHKAPWDAFWGQRYAILYDADGNLISLFAS